MEGLEDWGLLFKFKKNNTFLSFIYGGCKSSFSGWCRTIAASNFMQEPGKFGQNRAGVKPTGSR